MTYTDNKNHTYQAGVSHGLAEFRSKQINNVYYDLSFVIPQNKNIDIRGKLNLVFKLDNIDDDVILDFQNNAENIIHVVVNSSVAEYVFNNEHIIIHKKLLKTGTNTLTIEFISGNASLNRHDDYLYTLFVPDKASIAFPCFDQPDIKAKYKLNLQLPQSWDAVSNAKILQNTLTKSGRTIEFDETNKISTYHFAFVSGKLQKVKRTKNHRTINFYYIKVNDESLKTNIDALFDMHFMSVEWMEKYTSIAYPFGKLDFIAIPSFQFGGMEHVGAIYYRDSRMFLSESSTVEEIVKRASIIAHEVSHMWFGNLVTMKWFNDVWLKEVYAELFAAKIVYPMFPDMNQDLNFITGNYPRAYQTDRSEGTHPIQQNLDNLKFAGTLYGDIIYYKAPIIMANLEQMIGTESLQNGLIEYLKTYSYANAEWQDLINIFDKHTKFDLNEWSKTWIMQAGMPTISSKVKYENDIITEFTLMQNDDRNKQRIWKQNLKILFYKDGEKTEMPIYFDKSNMNINEAKGLQKPDFILINGAAYGYGYFVLDELSKQYILDNITTLKDNLVRTSLYITMFQAVVNNNLEAVKFQKAMINALKDEPIKQNIQLILNYIEITWWYFINNSLRLKLSLELENNLLIMAASTENKEVKSAIFETLISIFISKSTQDYLYDKWKYNKDFENMKLSSSDYSKIALALSLRDYPKADYILNEQLNSIDNEERKAKMQFIMPAASSDEKKRNDFFTQLQNPENRKHEIWVRSGLYYLHHPLRAKYSVKYLHKTLDMLEEIQRTGDIFFPKNWLAYSIGRYNSKEAADIVNKFLTEHPNYNENLKSKILQLSDYLFRVEKMKNN